jgi:hypothetical protein
MSESTIDPNAMHEGPQPAEQKCLCCGKGPALSQMLQLMMPADAAGGHFRNAGIELLKGFREIIDQRIQAMQQEPKHGTKLNVE